MKSSRLSVFLLVPLFVLACAACKTKTVSDDGLAAARRALGGTGARIAARTLEEGRTKRLERIRAAASELGPAFVLPIIQDRVTQLSAGLGAKRAAAVPEIGEGSWFALSSDGSVFTSVGGEVVTPFSRPFQEVAVVRAALTDATAGSAVIAWPRDGASHAIIDVVPATIEGATAGAVVILTPLATESARVRDAVRRGGAALAQSGACLRVAADVACSDVPDAAARAAGGNSFAGAAAATADLATGSVRGVLSSGVSAEGMPRAILWTASRSRH